MHLHPSLRAQRTCEEHAPADDGDVEDGRLGDELEGAVQVEQREDVLRAEANCII